jgi:hypothetical protein
VAASSNPETEDADESFVDVERFSRRHPRSHSFVLSPTSWTLGRPEIGEMSSKSSSVSDT